MKFEKLSDSKFVAMEQNQLNKVKGGCCTPVITGRKDGTTTGDGTNCNDCIN